MQPIMKKIEEGLIKALMLTCTAAVFVCLALILGTIIVKGAGSVNLDMLTKTPRGGYYLGKGGGIFNAIAGSFMLSVAATAAALAMSVPLVLYINVYSKGSRLAALVRMSLDILWGVPSIVYGAFGFTVMMLLGMKTSLLGGIATVSILILPIMARGMDAVVALVPGELLDASYSLGATRLETAWVVVRQTLPGMVSAALIAFGRGIGDAASVIFTAGFSDRIPASLFEPAATLPLAIFYQLGTPFPEVQNRAYASAFILTLLILGVSITARLLAYRFKKD
jgi:phosphate transport system permease protein